MFHSMWWGIPFRVAWGATGGIAGINYQGLADPQLASTNSVVEADYWWTLAISSLLCHCVCGQVLMCMLWSCVYTDMWTVESGHRAGASYFRLVYAHCMRLSVNKLGACAPPGKLLKWGTLRSLLRPFLGKNATTIIPPVISVAREAIEPNCRRWPLRTTPMLAPPQFARSSHAP